MPASAIAASIAAMPSITVRWWARTVLRYPTEFAVIVKIVGSSVGNRTDFHAHSDFNSLCRRTNSTAPAAHPALGPLFGQIATPAITLSTLSANDVRNSAGPAYARCRGGDGCGVLVSDTGSHRQPKLVVPVDKSTLIA
jgi:hypothetical protein